MLTTICWWIAKEVCDILGIVRPNDALRGLDSDEKQLVKISTGQSRGNPNRYVINNPDLYQLTIQSDQPQANEIGRRITHRELPMIRGGYIHGAEDMTEMEIRCRPLDIRERQIASRDKRIEEMAPVERMSGNQFSYLKRCMSRSRRQLGHSFSISVSIPQSCAEFLHGVEVTTPEYM